MIVSGGQATERASGRSPSGPTSRDRCVPVAMPISVPSGANARSVTESSPDISRTSRPSGVPDAHRAIGCARGRVTPSGARATLVSGASLPRSVAWTREVCNAVRNASISAGTGPARLDRRDREAGAELRIRFVDALRQRLGRAAPRAGIGCQRRRDQLLQKRQFVRVCLHPGLRRLQPRPGQRVGAVTAGLVPVERRPVQSERVGAGPRVRRRSPLPAAASYVASPRGRRRRSARRRRGR